jgi:hypothetical protein
VFFIFLFSFTHTPKYYYLSHLSPALYFPRILRRLSIFSFYLVGSVFACSVSAGKGDCTQGQALTTKMDNI